MSSFLDDVVAAVEARGVAAVSLAADVSAKRIRKFLREPAEVRISTFSRICRAVDMPHGDIHLIDQTTGKCITCTNPPEFHQPLLREVP